MSTPEMRPEKHQWHASLTSDTACLAGLRETVREAAECLGFGEHAVLEIVLAIDEAITNVIRHGYENSPGQPIDVTLESTRFNGRPALKVTVCDCGRQVDPDTIVGRDLEDVRPGGLGTHIIRQIMDDVEYSLRQPRGMSLRMIKLLEAHSDGA